MDIRLICPRRVQDLMIRLLLVISIGPCVLFRTSAVVDAQEISRDVRRILSAACLKCHGPDETTREAGLRLDTADGLFEIRDGQPVIRKGDPHSSLLIRRILSDNPDEQMPPPASGKSLTDAQRDLLVRWVTSGAEWSPHWSFVPPIRPEVPAPVTGSPAPPVSEIDRFLQHRQQQAGLVSAPLADAPTLVRRVFLDLIGLPPTVAEADHWIPRLQEGERRENSLTQLSISESAWSELVDHLLARPEYGERQARRWLDLARYADTNGYEKDRPRSIWPYRDWVIQALNDDLPFDQFTIEQLAGDMLPDATSSQHVATGFHRNTMLNEEGGIDPLEFRYHAMTDRVATTGTVWLGLTLGCAQCHTHKYDPITQSEYYGIFAFLNNADEPSLKLPQPGDEALQQQQQQQAAELLNQLPGLWPVPKDSSAEPVREADAAFAAWLTENRARAVNWRVLRPSRATSNLPLLSIESDGGVFASGDTTKQDHYELEFEASAAPVTALRLEALPDDRLPGGGPGTTYYEGSLGDFYLNELTIEADGRVIPVSGATESYARNKFGNQAVSAALTIDGDVQTGWSVAGAEGERHTAVYRLGETIPAGSRLRIRMIFGRHFASSLGRFRFSATDAERSPVALRLSGEVEHLLTFPEEQLTVEQRSQLRSAFLLSAPQLEKPADEIRRLLKPPAGTTTLVLQERPAETPRATHRHHRGEYLQPMEPVAPATPASLSAWPDEFPRNRLGFARWLVDRRNPLTARVAVNREWAAFFGRGLVETVDDFGLQGTPPVHPELLDWLAVTWMDDDHWSLKSLHRRMTCSSAYRLQSAATWPVEGGASGGSTGDPDNQLLTRASRVRLDAEILRDSILKAAGVLSSRHGGPPVRPLQPPGITEVTFGSPKWDPSEGEDRYRRSIYTFIKRTAPFAMITTFDGPSGESCQPRRPRSNTPLQALTLLNDPMFLDVARHCGRELAARSAEPANDRIKELFRRLLTRTPDDSEIRELGDFLEAQRKEFHDHPTEALALTGEPSTSSAADVAGEAAWIALCRAMFCLDETLTRP